ncbi:MAG: phage virion morphogenesis protein [Verrucomicrobiales bacterium]|jgi:phage gpG-like protein|nr:phage virion morphogenesis protein [Verrucomicrobiales bacterium]
MFDYELNGEAARKALREAAARLDDMTPVYTDIGEYLLEQRRARFRSGTDPEGKPWAPKRQSTLDRYKRLGYGTLNRPLIGPSKALSRQIHRIVSKDGVVIGSSLAYARTMQEGAAKGAFGSDSRGNPLPWGNIPARRWLDLSDQEELEIVAIAEEHLEGLLEQ